MLRRLRNSVMDTPLEPLARRLYLRLDRSIEGMCERDTLAIMKRYLKRTSNCIDIGAHRGSILGELVTRAPLGEHFAFEPVPRHYQYLKRHFPRVKVYPYALSNVTSERQFMHVMNQPTRSGFLEPPIHDGQVEMISVQTERLDHIIPANQKVDYIKIDVEGAEYEVLQGASQTIRRNRLLVMLEYSQATGAPYGVKIAQMFDMIAGECGLNLWLPKCWLVNQPPMGREEFIAAVEQGVSYYFVLSND